MGRKSLIKSTIKKTDITAMPEEEKKKSKTAGKPSAKSGSKKADQNKPKSALTKVPKAVDPRELIFRKFESWRPEALFSVPPDPLGFEGFTAPPAPLDSSSMALIIRTFDLSGPPEEMPSNGDAQAYAPLPEDTLPVITETIPPEREETTPAIAASTLQAPLIETLNTDTVAPMEVNPSAAPEKIPVSSPQAHHDIDATDSIPVSASRPSISASPCTPGPIPGPPRTPSPLTARQTPKKTGGISPLEKFTRVTTFAGFTMLLLLLIVTSAMNQRRYYLEPTESGLMILKGRFSPMGKELFQFLPGMPAPQKLKPSYSKEDIFPVIFNFYQDKADALLMESQIPNYESYKRLLSESLAYAVTDTLKAAALKRLNAVDFMILVHKADVAAGKPDTRDQRAALELLQDAAALAGDDAQAALVNRKMEVLKTRISE